ncbi:V-type ATP synthase subunit F [Methanogenium sp. MK-MG]|uniref:V-type ATP synthase subunit F n=1 Tax=Methanogenium sp. MK-MG TaxID=2599926 RepID=UPI0013EBCE6E|nr:V-type ATP synthase subunit F [Methanogenium sp. MK-MG]KAF1078820.1 V-type ATP synthase subunit F [Methanogenium sp. MK-MG]
MNIIAIGDRMMVSACRAGGISDTIPCRDAEEARRALEEVLEHPDTGVVCVLDRYLKEISVSPPRKAYPVVIGIPGPEGPVHGEDAVSAAVRKVAGRHMPGADR